MESPQHIKSRLKSVKNIGQITKAMEVVSATKMRKAQEVALKSRAYAFKALELLETLVASAKTDEEKVNPLAMVPLAQQREVKNTLIVVVASDKGLAGAFNTQVLRVADAFLANEKGEMKAIAIGKRAIPYVTKKNMQVIESFTGYGDHATTEEIAPLSDLIVQGFLEGKWDKVVTVSMHFRSTLKQQPLVRQILPLEVEKIRETVKEIVPEQGRYAQTSNDGMKIRNNSTEFILEPSPAELLSSLIPHLITMQLYHLILEANASEHSARMVAMKTASDNAKDLAEGLLLEFNKARQAHITKEIIEITSTMNALT